MCCSWALLQSSLSNITLTGANARKPCCRRIMAFMDFRAAFKFPLSNVKSTTFLPAFHSIDSFRYASILKGRAIIPPFMSKSTTAHPKGQFSIIPQIEKLLTEQTSVILQAVNEKLHAEQTNRWRGEESRQGHYSTRRGSEEIRGPS